MSSRHRAEGFPQSVLTPPLSYSTLLLQQTTIHTTLRTSMPQTLFFISPNQYVPGHRLGSYDLNYELMEANKKHDTSIDEHSPYPHIKRRKSILTFHSPYECMYHTQKVFNTRIFTDFYLYKVISDSCHNAPLSLLELLYDHHMGGPVFRKLVSEYWNPTYNWVLFECLCEYAFVLSRHKINSNQDEIDAVLFSHQSDLQTARKLFHIEQ